MKIYFLRSTRIEKCTNLLHVLESGVYKEDITKESDDNQNDDTIINDIANEVGRLVH